MTLMDGLLNESTNMLTVVSLNKEIAFVAKENFSPISNSPVAVFFAQRSLFLFMIVVKSCLFRGPLAIHPDESKSFLSSSLVFLGSFLLCRSNWVISPISSLSVWG